jgi:SAM-dependent methyltransferase
MPEKRPSIIQRLKHMLERVRELLAAPASLTRLELQMADLQRHAKSQAQKLDESCTVIIQKLDELVADIKSEVSAELSFSIHDYTESVADLQQLVGDLREGLNTRIGSLEKTFQSEVKNLATDLSTSLNSRINNLETFQSETRNLVAELNTSLNSRMNSLETFQSESRNLVTDLNTSLNSRMNSLETYQSEARNLIANLDTSLNSRINNLENLQSETKNLIDHVRTASEARFNAIHNQQFETRNLVDHLITSINSRLDSFENERFQAIYDQTHVMIATQMELLNQIRDPKEFASHPTERYKPIKGSTWKASLERARRDFPTVYPLWTERLDSMRDAFRQTKVGNAAWGGDIYSRIFRNFVERYADGRILDVGCGIFGRPYYLSSYPAQLLSGIDPLEPEERVDFEFARGISEYLPWPDSSFSTVISATSLDHCLSLDRSLAEVRRVLRSGGHYLLWIGSVPGAPKYEPTKPEFAPADKFHLFHFDVNWFEPLLPEVFNIVDRLELHKIGYSHVMYCLERKVGRASRS